jgi:integrase
MKRHDVLLTTDAIRDLVNPPEWIWDTEQDGLALRRGFTWYCRVPGQRPYPIGTMAALDLSAARLRVRRDLEADLDGVDARAERKERAEQSVHRRTLAQASGEYLAARCGKVSAAMYRAHERYLTGEYFRPLHGRELGKISRGDVAERFRFIQQYGVEGGKPSKNAASGARGSLSEVYKFAIAQGWTKANPVDGTINPAPRKDAVERQRVLADEEVAAVWAATAGAQDEHRVIRLLALLGNRLEEVVGLQWSELKAGVWTLPAERTKNRESRRIPLPAVAREILAGVPRVEGRDRVFDCTGRNVRRVATMLGVANWRLHDLRRTMRTGLTRLGVLDEVAELCIGHKREKLVRIYSVEERLGEQAKAFERWADKVTGKPAPDNVIALSRAA